MSRYYVKSILSGAVTVVVARNVYDAVKKGSKYFSEPNRPNVPVRVLS